MNYQMSRLAVLNEQRFVRCGVLSKEEEKMLRTDTIQRGYSLIVVDLGSIRTREDLIDKLAQALQFPKYFGRNWDAFLDLVTDLSWNSASGYVLLLKNADALLNLPSEHLDIFIRLCLATVKRWQSGEDEEGKAITPTPFYFLFEGSNPLCRLLFELQTS